MQSQKTTTGLHVIRDAIRQRLRGVWAPQQSRKLAEKLKSGPRMVTSSLKYQNLITTVDHLSTVGNNSSSSAKRHHRRDATNIKCTQSATGNNNYHPYHGDPQTIR
ncbi:unnamed protein product [Lactuca virosa]|uniref:Uncharacterized protein n=1 Tax=Lactuca virosa TaxID=75947 RepID=A0AAU9PLD2_9ASTR|nr:unnamed protein product [Lactuca virosa]